VIIVLCIAGVIVISVIVMIATAAPSKSIAAIHPQHDAEKNLAEIKLDAIGFENPPGGVPVRVHHGGQQP